MNQGQSLAFRLFAGAAAWALVLLLVGAVALTTLFQRAIIGTLDDRLSAAVGSLVATVELADDGAVSISREPTDPDYTRVFSGRYWQVNQIGGEDGSEPRLASRSLWDETLFASDALIERTAASPGQTFYFASKGPEGVPLRLAAQALILSEESGPLIMMAAEDRRAADTSVRNFAIIAGVMFLIFAAAIAAGVFLQVRIGLEPVLRMRTSVAQVREGEAERVAGSYPNELQPLADELNAMLDHSRELVERSRTHVGNLAHALKTPLAVLANESRQHSDHLPDVVERQTELMAKQVDHHLRRARAAAHAKAVGARTDIASVIEDIARTLEKIYARRGIAISREIDPALGFRGERQDLEEIIGNLTDNACKWAASAVHIDAEMQANRMVQIRIMDDGPGLSEDECETALQRGVRLDEQAPGSGLGLAIVSDLVKAYDGEVSLGRASLGGLCVCILLPATSR